MRGERRRGGEASRLTRVLALVAGLTVLGTVPALAPAQPLFSAAQDPDAGTRVFADKGCVRCHATDGEGAKVGPNLARVTRPHTFYDLGAALWNHAPKMAARMRASGITRPRLDAKEMGDLAAYLFTLDYFERKGRPQVGKRLFAEKHCVACHRVGGEGGRVGPSLDTMRMVASPIYVATLMWNHGAQMAEAMKERGIERPTFSAGELTDLIAYLNQAAPRPAHGALYVLPGRADHGLQVFTERRCVECHSLRGYGRPGIPDLVERAGRKSPTEFAASMWNKAPAMQAEMARRGIAAPPLTPEDAADLVALLYSVQYFARSGDPTRGVSVATAKGCLACHGLHGERGKPAGDLVAAREIDTPAGVMASLWNHAFIDDPRPTDERRALKTMSGAELADLVAYLHTLRRRP